VLDFCAGFGGRLLGTLTLKRHYIGVDPCSLQTSGLKNMIESLKDVAVGTAEIHEDSAEEFLGSMPANSVDLVFSSPPYYDTEIYSEELTQSANKYRTYNEWLELFLHRTFEYAHRNLRPNGFFVINVADNRRFQLQADVLRIALPLFGRPKIVRMMMRCRPAQQWSTNQLFRWEPLYVFKKSFR
jgi:tRNA1(Val) A37 N6-methylase TrmN6